MRNQYEYELGLLTGMNEAIMNQNDQMRDRILQQNAKIQEVWIDDQVFQIALALKNDNLGLKINHLTTYKTK